MTSRSSDNREHESWWRGDLLKDGLYPCPWCGAPAVDVACEYITCGGEPDCPGKNLKVERWKWNDQKACGLIHFFVHFGDGLHSSILENFHSTVMRDAGRFISSRLQVNDGDDNGQ